jgi:Ca2+-binding RTX toxin-like protein
MGDAGANRLSGASGRDSIYGLGGEDLLFGRNSGDYLNGGTDRDGLYGGNGDDVLFGGTGNDLLHGGAGEDRLDGGAGIDTANYSDDRAGLVADLFAGEVLADGGADHLTSIERFYGSAFGDVITAVDLQQPPGTSTEPGRGWTIFGMGGTDFIAGGTSNDYLYGDAGNDGLDGNAGNDHVHGGEGDDILFGGAGNDLLIGGAGKDEFDALINIAGNASEPSFIIGQTTVLDFVRGADRINADFFSGDRSDRIGNNETFAKLDSNHDGKLTSLDRWIDVRTVDPEGKAARSSLVIDVGNAVAQDLVGSGHTMTLYDVTSLTRSDFAA